MNYLELTNYVTGKKHLVPEKAIVSTQSNTDYTLVELNTGYTLKVVEDCIPTFNI